MESLRKEALQCLSKLENTNSELNKEELECKIKSIRSKMVLLKKQKRDKRERENYIRKSSCYSSWLNSRSISLQNLANNCRNLN